MQGVGRHLNQSRGHAALARRERHLSLQALHHVDPNDLGLTWVGFNHRHSPRKTLLQSARGHAAWCLLEAGPEPCQPALPDPAPSSRDGCRPCLQRGAHPADGAGAGKPPRRRCLPPAVSQAPPLPHALWQAGRQAGSSVPPGPTCTVTVLYFPAAPLPAYRPAALLPCCLLPAAPPPCRCAGLPQGHILEKLQDPEEVQRMLHALRSSSHFGDTMADRIVRETLEARAVGGHGAALVATAAAAAVIIAQLCPAADRQVGCRSAGGVVLAVGTAARGLLGRCGYRPPLDRAPCPFAWFWCVFPLYGRRPT